MEQPTPTVPPTQRIVALIAGFGGVLLIVEATMSGGTYYTAPGPQALFDLPLRLGAQDPLLISYVLASVIAAVAGLVLLRRWPLLLPVAALLAVPSVLPQGWQLPLPSWYWVVAHGGRTLAIVATLAAAQAMIRRGEAGLGVLVAGLAVAAPLLGRSLAAGRMLLRFDDLLVWHRVLVLAAVAAVLPAAWLLRRGDRDAGDARPDGPTRWGWRRLRLVIGGAVALLLAVPLGLLTTDRLSTLLDIRGGALFRHTEAETAIVASIALLIVGALAAMAGRWALGGTLLAGTIQVGMVAPMALALGALRFTSAPYLAVIAGIALGAGLAWGRHRFALTAAVTVAAAATLFIAYAATTGSPGKLADQGSTIPGVIIAVLVSAAATAVIGCIAWTLAPTGAAPATLGPLAGMFALAGRDAIVATYTESGDRYPSVGHLTTPTVLVLVCAAGVGGLGLAHQWATRRAERLRTEQIRRDAADAERNRLARPIHDGVLQVLALMQRHGTELGGAGPQLATLAGEQELALRSLLAGDPQATQATPAGRRQTRLDLRAALTALASPSVEVAAPADPVLLPDLAAAELTAAVQAALDNVRRHAGAAARAWILLEDEGGAVRVTVRDDGVGFVPSRLAEAADAGRLGVTQSMRGRVADLGGTTEIYSRPGRGTEVEFCVPRQRSGPTLPS